MSKDTIYARTQQGNDLLDNPKGRISGDEMLLLALIDGKTSIEGIVKKVPPSVRGHLDAVFSRLLSAGIIMESGRAEIGSAELSTVAVTTSAEGSAKASCAGVEQELEEVRTQLAATKARQKDVEVGFHKLRLRISAYTEIRHAKLTKKLREFAAGVESADELRASFANELSDSLESLNQLNQMIAEQQHLLDRTIRLKAFQGELSPEQLQKEHEEEEARMASSHPNYKKLRGLEFFKGFANSELLQFLKIAKWQEMNAGDIVLDEGDVGMPFFIIVTGEVTVYKGAHKLTTLDQGDFFGEFAYLSGEEPYRTARVVAESPCELLMVDPLDIEFASVQLRLHVVEALLRGQVRRTLISSKPMNGSAIGSYPNKLDVASQ